MNKKPRLKSAVFSAAISLYCQLASQGAAFTSFKPSLLTLASPQRALFFTYSFSLLFLVYTPVALLLRMDLRTPLRSFYPLRYHAFPAHEYIFQLLHHSPYSTYIISFTPKMSVSKLIFQICMSVKHHPMLTFLSDIP